MGSWGGGSKGASEERASSPFYSESGTPGCCQVTVGQGLDRMLTSIPPDLEDPTPSHRHTCWQNTYEHKIKINYFVKKRWYLKTTFSTRETFCLLLLLVSVNKEIKHSTV